MHRRFFGWWIFSDCILYSTIHRENSISRLDGRVHWKKRLYIHYDEWRKARILNSCTPGRMLAARKRHSMQRFSCQFMLQWTSQICYIRLSIKTITCNSTEFWQIARIDEILTVQLHYKTYLWEKANLFRRLYNEKKKI